MVLGTLPVGACRFLSAPTSTYSHLLGASEERNPPRAHTGNDRKDLRPALLTTTHQNSCLVSCRLNFLRPPWIFLGDLSCRSPCIVRDALLFVTLILILGSWEASRASIPVSLLHFIFVLKLFQASLDTRAWKNQPRTGRSSSGAWPGSCSSSPSSQCDTAGLQDHPWAPTLLLRHSLPAQIQTRLPYTGAHLSFWSLDQNWTASPPPWLQQSRSLPNILLFTVSISKLPTAFLLSAQHQADLLVLLLLAFETSTNNWASLAVIDLL